MNRSKSIYVIRYLERFYYCSGDFEVWKRKIHLGYFFWNWKYASCKRNQFYTTFSDILSLVRYRLVSFIGSSNSILCDLHPICGWGWVGFALIHFFLFFADRVGVNFRLGFNFYGSGPITQIFSRKKKVRNIFIWIYL